MTKKIIMCALFAALIAVGTRIIIPTPLLPLTLQTLMIILSGLILGAKTGALAVSVYVLAGLAGLPVFTQGGGLGYVVHPTFGYTISFILGAWLAGFLAEKLKPSILNLFLSGFAAIILIYAIGIPYYYAVARWHTGNILAAKTLLMYFVLMPLPGDILKCFLAALIVYRLRKFFPAVFNY